MFFYKSEDEKSERYHLNRAVTDLSFIKNMVIDDQYIYLIGNNIHYLYRHSVLNNFLHKQNEYLFE